MRMRTAALLACLAAGSASAEVALVNLHVQPGVLLDFKTLKPLGGGVFKVDVAPGEGVIAVQAQLYFLGANERVSLAQGSLFGGGLGVRLRLLNDETGFAFGTEGVKGNLFSNLFLEAHLNYNHGGFMFGADVGVGLELSVFNGLSMAPTLKMFFNGFNERFEPTLMLGLEFSLGTPFNPGKETDGDGDGLKARVDKCPFEAEDKDGFEDEDGCPDGDNDKDEVPDEKDKCPKVAGPSTNDGCPIIPDDDGDGIPNATDKCRTEKEDKDGFEDEDGCPDTDDDKDGVADSFDKCPRVAEDKDAFEDEDGCPDLDDDKDGVPDEKDKCPTAAGPAETNGCPQLDDDKDGVLNEADNCVKEPGPKENQGCPAAQKQLVVITREELKILDKVYFATGKATILPKSLPLLDQVASVLNQQQRVKLMQVEGHTDSTGKAETNLKLSDDRAKAIVAYLVKKGVDAKRLVAKGFGPSRPAQSNDTPAGRDANRRVEFKILEQD